VPSCPDICENKIGKDVVHNKIINGEFLHAFTLPKIGIIKCELLKVPNIEFHLILRKAEGVYGRINLWPYAIYTNFSLN
jgi:hypothetical protein